jgi:hypothetical protein
MKTMDGSPPDLHNEICGKHRVRVAKGKGKGKGKAKAQPEPVEETPEATEASDAPSDSDTTFSLANLQGVNINLATLLSGPGNPVGEPIVVFAGPPKGAAQKTAAWKRNFPEAEAASKSGQGASQALANSKAAVASFGTTPLPSTLSSDDTAASASDTVPLPRARPKFARVKAAKR